MKVELYDDVYNIIFKYVNTMDVIRNARCANKAMYEATKYVIRIYDADVKFKHLFMYHGGQLKLMFLHLKELRGYVNVRWYENNNSTIQRGLKQLVNAGIKELRINVEFLEEEKQIGKMNRVSSINFYTIYSHLIYCPSFRYLSVSRSIKCISNKIKVINFTRTNNIVKIHINGVKNIKMCKIKDHYKVSDILYDYHLVLNNTTGTFLGVNNKTRSNITSIIITHDTGHIIIPFTIHYWPNIKTVILECIEAECWFLTPTFNAYHLLQINHIITNYDLIYSLLEGPDNEQRIRQILKYMKQHYTNAKIKLIIYIIEECALDNDILYHHNVTLERR